MIYQILKTEQDKEETEKAALEEKMRLEDEKKTDLEKKKEEDKKKRDEEDKKKEEEEVGIIVFTKNASFVSYWNYVFV